MKNICIKCGKELNGLTFGYSDKYLCSVCTDDKTNPLYCEKGCKVKAIHLDNGYEKDIEFAKKYLVQDGIYNVERVEVGGYNSTIFLSEFPGIAFNTVQFIRCD